MLEFFTRNLIKSTLGPLSWNNSFQSTVSNRIQTYPLYYQQQITQHLMQTRRFVHEGNHFEESIYTSLQLPLHITQTLSYEIR